MHQPEIPTRSRINVVRGQVRKLLNWFRPVTFLLRRPQSPANDRYAYQVPHIKHAFQVGARVLDVGSGGDPFPLATILTDRYLQATQHRYASFAARGKPTVISDIHALPFESAQFDYVVCAHVLEHVADPIAACRELQRVAKAGLIETPTLMKDALFSWAKGMHNWHVIAIGDRLVFFEYGQRQLEGVRSNEWNRLIFGPSYHPLQEVFNENQDIFNNLFEWKHCFAVTVFTLDGAVEHLDRPSRPANLTAAGLT